MSRTPERKLAPHVQAAIAAAQAKFGENGCREVALAGEPSAQRPQAPHVLTAMATAAQAQLMRAGRSVSPLAAHVQAAVERGHQPRPESVRPRSAVAQRSETAAPRVVPGIVRPDRRPPFSQPSKASPAVIQRADGDYFSRRRIRVREVHGNYGTRRDPGIRIVADDGGYAEVTYQDGDGDLAYIPHLDALNFTEQGTGVGYLAIHQLMLHLRARGKIRIQLGTPVFDKIGNSPEAQAAVHMYREMGFDVSSSAAAVQSVVEVEDILRVTAGKIRGKGWVAGDPQSETTPLVGTAEGRGGSCSDCCCYLTSACVGFKGLADDGEELTVLRAFRDGYMRASAERRVSLSRYYDTAPQIVAAIDGSLDPGTAYEWIYGVVTQSVWLIREGNWERAMIVYGSAVEALERRFLPGCPSFEFTFAREPLPPIP